MHNINEYKQMLLERLLQLRCLEYGDEERNRSKKDPDAERAPKWRKSHLHRDFHQLVGSRRKYYLYLKGVQHRR